MNVNFLRPSDMKLLPMPVKTNRTLIEVLHEVWPHFVRSTLVILAAWLVQALWPTGPYFVLALIGSKGSGKSLIADWLIELTDPNYVRRAALFSDERELVIVASQRHVLCFDNVSNLSQAKSDILCRLTTGAGFATRKLHTDDQLVSFSVQKPVILTAIDDCINREDLKDRTLQVRLLPIQAEGRKEEEVLNARFDRSKREIFGALLNCLACALRNRNSVELDWKPRNADAYRVIVAAEEAIGLESGEFRAILENQASEANASMIEGSIVAPLVLAYMSKHSDESMTAAEWLQTLREENDCNIAVLSRQFPQDARTLSMQLRRLQTALEAQGLSLEWDRNKSQRLIRIAWLGIDAAIPSPAGRTDPNEA